MADFEKQQELALNAIAGDSRARDALIIDLQSVAKWLADERVGKSSTHFEDVASVAIESAKISKFRTNARGRSRSKQSRISKRACAAMACFSVQRRNNMMFFKKKTHLPREVVPVPTEDGGFALVETEDFIKRDLKHYVFAVDEDGELYYMAGGSVVFLKDKIVGFFKKVERISNDRTDYRRSNLLVEADD